MKLTDVLPLETWKELEEEIFNRSGLQASVFDVDGIRITDTKRWANRLCPVIKADDRGQSYICAVAHMNLANEARDTHKPVIGECDAGLSKVVVPIFVGDEFLGAAGGCGLLLDDGEVDSFMLNKTLDLPEEKTEELAEGIVSLSTAQMEELADFISDWLRRHLPASK
ncbi:MAG: PocR ligand-binding domain-containing protein [Desulfobacterales bacterium]|jgi:ligand-binding sensor protein|nr:PocR ligand-binding domain-containing protein [Desulfobacteraceae bacterium]MDD3992778.1 PocR ligand-binding domain-containing protein [Desulfobacteraceae bacterium]MDY0312276.1 PocR ligand-binding domain-containing protein [Desulfobacterales bacterium]